MKSRNITEVMDRILLHVPKDTYESKELTKLFNSIKGDLFYTAPEIEWKNWENLCVSLDVILVEPDTEWKETIGYIIRNEE